MIFYINIFFFVNTNFFDCFNKIYKNILVVFYSYISNFQVIIIIKINLFFIFICKLVTIFQKTIKNNYILLIIIFENKMNSKNVKIYSK